MTREWNTRQPPFTVYERAFCSPINPQLPIRTRSATETNPTFSSLGRQFFGPPVPRIIRGGRGSSPSNFPSVVGILPPILEIEVRFRSGCAEFNKHVLEMIHSRPPRPVILSAMWTLVTESDLPLLRETIAQKQWGSHVIVVGPSPTFEFAVSQVYFRLASDGENPAFAQAIDDSRTSTRLRQIALEAGATYIDPRDAMCKFESVCKIRDGNELLYVDSRHLSQRGSGLVTEQVVRALRPRNDVHSLLRPKDPSETRVSEWAQTGESPAP